MGALGWGGVGWDGVASISAPCLEGAVRKTHTRAHAHAKARPSPLWQSLRSAAHLYLKVSV